MRTARAVTVIPATAGRFAQTLAGQPATKRVAAYARVSTDNDEQLSSYEAQKDYYTRHIQSNPVWEFVDVYADEGISATSTKKRAGFNRMIADAMNGKIDLIITKSVSRIARNTVDSLTTVRQLKEKGVEVYFEKENIYTLDSKGELLITIMSSIAQEESRSISSNVAWGQRKRFADGKVSLPYGQFLGYEKGEDGLPKIVEKEAAVIRLIYKLFLEGKTPSGIAKHLTVNKIPTPGGKEVWQPSTVKSILQNEKYKGDAILQKTFTVDFLTKKKKINEGEIPQYYVENSHPAIITPEVFDLVQQELIRRKSAKGYKTGSSIFSGKIVCGECGSFFGSKVWHSNSKYKRTIWQCNHKFNNNEKCKTPHLYEDTVKQLFVSAFNSLIKNKAQILMDFDELIKHITDYTLQEEKCRKLDEECLKIKDMLDKLIEENSHFTLNQTEYNERYAHYAAKYDKLQEDRTALTNEIVALKEKRTQTKAFIQILESRDELLSEFDEGLWKTLLESMIVHTEQEIIFQFKDGTELPWSIDQMRGKI